MSNDIFMSPIFIVIGVLVLFKRNEFIEFAIYANKQNYKKYMNIDLHVGKYWTLLLHLITILFGAGLIVFGVLFFIVKYKQL